MEHLEDVERGTEKDLELMDSNAGVVLDPEIEQDNDEQSNIIIKSATSELISKSH